jgi:hypothetical protein
MAPSLAVEYDSDNASGPLGGLRGNGRCHSAITLPETIPIDGDVGPIEQRGGLLPRRQAAHPTSVRSLNCERSKTTVELSG